jgi:hypothetical protein
VNLLFSENAVDLEKVYSTWGCSNKKEAPTAKKIKVEQQPAGKSQPMEEDSSRISVNLLTTLKD